MTIDANTTMEKEINMNASPVAEMTEDQMIDIAAAKILNQFLPAFEELAK